MISLTVSLLSVNLSYHFREKLYFLGYDLSSRKYEFLLGKINYVFYGIFWKNWKNFKNLFRLILRIAKIAVLSDLHWVSQKLFKYIIKNGIEFHIIITQHKQNIYYIINSNY